MPELTITLSPTDEFHVAQGQLCRLWAGQTAGGVPCVVLVAGIGVDEEIANDPERLRELAGLLDVPATPPTAIGAIRDAIRGLRRTQLHYRRMAASGTVAENIAVASGVATALEGALEEVAGAFERLARSGDKLERVHALAELRELHLDCRCLSAQPAEDRGLVECRSCGGTIVTTSTARITRDPRDPAAA